MHNEEGKPANDPMPIQPAHILADITTIAQGAGEIIMRHFVAPISTTLKSSRIDIVTAADTEAEGYIVKELLARFPDHHIVGEEGGDRARRPDQHRIIGLSIRLMAPLISPANFLISARALHWPRPTGSRCWA